jgi:hypothetical protein
MAGELARIAGRNRGTPMKKVVLLLIVGGAVAFVVVKRKQAAAAEQALWDEATGAVPKTG